MAVTSEVKVVSEKTHTIQDQLPVVVEVTKEEDFLSWFQKHLFVLIYQKQGDKFYKQFLHEGNRASAIERARQHCQLLAVKFIWCEHAIHDLALEEAKVMDGM